MSQTLEVNETLGMDRVIGTDRVLDTLAQEAGKQGKALTTDAMTIFWPMLLKGVVWQVPKGEPFSEETVRATLEPILDDLIKKFVQDLPASESTGLEGPVLPKPDGTALVQVEVGSVIIEIDDLGVARLEGTRITVSQIALEHTRLGLTLEQIQENHPHLSLVQVYVAFAYYSAHKDEVDAQIAASLEFADQSRQESGPSPLAARLRSAGRMPAEQAA